MGGFKDYYGITSLHPVAIAAILLLSLAVLVVSRRTALAPLLIAATTIPMSQRLVIAGADFTLLRLLLLAYFARIIFRGEARGFVWGRLDTAVLIWTFLGTVIMTIHYGNTDALINRLGWSFDVLLTYFAVRVLVKDWGDILGLARFVSVLSVPIAAVFLFEWMTAYNLFSIFGGVPPETAMRAGRLRCQGPFPHPIIAGTFWAALLPVIWMQFREGHWSKRLTYAGTAACLLIIATTTSTTPVASAMVAFLAVGLFRWRAHRRYMWIGLALVAALLHFVIMEQPVYHLMARIDVTGGSTGWHRFVILETFLNNISDWYLTGESNPEKWRWQMRDITNQYIGEGLNGGILTLGAFVLVILLAFANVGRALRPSRESNEDTGSVAVDWKIWLVGTMIFVHAVTFFALGYFGQLSSLWYMQLAFAGCLGASLNRSTLGSDAQARPDQPHYQSATHGLSGAERI